MSTLKSTCQYKCANWAGCKNKNYVMKPNTLCFECKRAAYQLQNQIDNEDEG